jgi:hypothetical protein
MLIWTFFLVFACETGAPNLSEPFSYIMYTVILKANGTISPGEERRLLLANVT